MDPGALDREVSDFYISSQDDPEAKLFWQHVREHQTNGGSGSLAGSFQAVSLSNPEMFQSLVEKILKECQTRQRENLISFGKYPAIDEQQQDPTASEESLEEGESPSPGSNLKEASARSLRADDLKRKDESETSELIIVKYRKPTCEANRAGKVESSSQVFVYAGATQQSHDAAEPLKVTISNEFLQAKSQSSSKEEMMKAAEALRSLRRRLSSSKNLASTLSRELDGAIERSASSKSTPTPVQGSTSIDSMAKFDSDQPSFDIVEESSNPESSVEMTIKPKKTVSTFSEQLLEVMERLGALASPNSVRRSSDRRKVEDHNEVGVGLTASGPSLAKPVPNNATGETDWLSQATISTAQLSETSDEIITSQSHTKGKDLGSGTKTLKKLPPRSPRPISKTASNRGTKSDTKKREPLYKKGPRSVKYCTSEDIEKDRILKAGVNDLQIAQDTSIDLAQQQASPDSAATNPTGQLSLSDQVGQPLLAANNAKPYVSERPTPENESPRTPAKPPIISPPSGADVLFQQQGGQQGQDSFHTSNLINQGTLDMKKHFAEAAKMEDPRKYNSLSEYMSTGLSEQYQENEGRKARGDKSPDSCLSASQRRHAVKEGPEIKKPKSPAVGLFTRLKMKSRSPSTGASEEKCVSSPVVVQNSDDAVQTQPKRTMSPMKLYQKMVSRTRHTTPALASMQSAEAYFNFHTIDDEDDESLYATYDASKLDWNHVAEYRVLSPESQPVQMPLDLHSEPRMSFGMVWPRSYVSHSGASVSEEIHTKPPQMSSDQSKITGTSIGTVSPTSLMPASRAPITDPVPVNQAQLSPDQPKESETTSGGASVFLKSSMSHSGTSAGEVIAAKQVEAVAPMSAQLKPHPNQVDSEKKVDAETQTAILLSKVESLGDNTSAWEGFVTNFPTSPKELADEIFFGLMDAEPVDYRNSRRKMEGGFLNRDDSAEGALVSGDYRNNALATLLCEGAISEVDHSGAYNGLSRSVDNFASCLAPTSPCAGDHAMSVSYSDAQESAEYDDYAREDSLLSSHSESFFLNSHHGSTSTDDIQVEPRRGTGGFARAKPYFRDTRKRR
ncbi:hypothetical protein ACA910_018233 [Epithemia clementina (nom. ined.)]